MQRRIALRPLRIVGSVAYVPLTRGFESVIDLIDVPQVGCWNWFFRPSRRNRYASRMYYPAAGKPQTINLHRFLMCPAAGLVVDHINGDGLDNRRANMRVCTPTENARNTRTSISNTSGSKGVSWNAALNGWKASISVEGHPTYLGTFPSIEDAAAAYAEASARHHGAFGRVR